MNCQDPETSSPTREAAPSPAAVRGLRRILRDDDTIPQFERKAAEEYLARHELPPGKYEVVIRPRDLGPGTHRHGDDWYSNEECPCEKAGWPGRFRDEITGMIIRHAGFNAPDYDAEYPPIPDTPPQPIDDGRTPLEHKIRAGSLEEMGVGHPDELGSNDHYFSQQQPDDTTFTQDGAEAAGEIARDANGYPLDHILRPVKADNMLYVMVAEEADHYLEMFPRRDAEAFKAAYIAACVTYAVHYFETNPADDFDYLDGGDAGDPAAFAAFLGEANSIEPPTIASYHDQRIASWNEAERQTTALPMAPVFRHSQSKEPVCTPLHNVLEELPASTLVVNGGGDDTGTDAMGFVNLILVFAEPELRDAFYRNFVYTWIQTRDRCVQMTHSYDWRDRDGYGLAMSTYRIQDNGRDRKIDRNHHLKSHVQSTATRTPRS
jgi:hypothetical protein